MGGAVGYTRRRRVKADVAESDGPLELRHAHRGVGWVGAIAGNLMAWGVSGWSCWYLYMGMTRYPSAASFWCPSGRWGSTHIETVIYETQLLRFLFVVACWLLVRRCGRLQILARIAVVTSLAFWVVALAVAQGLYWRWPL